MKRLLTLVSLWILLTFLSGSASADSDAFEGGSFHPFTMTPLGDGCPVSSHSYFGVQLRDCDPVNRLFDDVALWQVVSGLRERGWTTIGLGSYQLLHLSRQDVPVAQAVAMYLQVPAGSEACPADGPGCRYHVRLWPAGWRSVVGAVHFETATLFGPHILLASWEFAESRLCADLDSLAMLSCTPNNVFLPTQAAIQSGGTWRGLENNANASLVSPAQSLPP